MERGEIAALRPYNASMGTMLETLSMRLHDKGGAHWRCPGKLPEERLRTMRHAGELRVAWTTGVLVGVGETREERVDALIAIRQLHERYGHVQEVIVQNFRAKDDTAMCGACEPSVFEMLRTIATARLILGRRVNIQAPPNLTPDAHGMYLLAGINDWGGISPLTPDYINPGHPWPVLRELRSTCAEAGFELRERLGLYPEYIRDRPEFVPDGIRPIVNRLTGGDGLVRPEEQRC